MRRRICECSVIVTFFCNDMSRLLIAGRYSLLREDPRPFTQGTGTANADALRRLYGLSVVPAVGSPTQSNRGPQSGVPVKLSLDTPDTLKPGVNGVPLTKFVKPETCQPFRTARLRRLSSLLPERIPGSG